MRLLSWHQSDRLATLEGSCVQGEGFGCVSAHPDHLGPGGQELQDPGALGVFSPSSVSLPANLVGTMVLKAEQCI